MHLQKGIMWDVSTVSRLNPPHQYSPHYFVALLLWGILNIEFMQTQWADAKRFAHKMCLRATKSYIAIVLTPFHLHVFGTLVISH